MTIIYPINGRNQRLGDLFKTPKHLLLYKGVPAIQASIEYMRERFPAAKILIIANERYVTDLNPLPAEIRIVSQTESQVETLHKGTAGLTGSVMFVDCDIVPVELNEPNGNTVYLFENKLWMKQYSNYLIEDGKVTGCNEKGEHHPYAGAGIYYFENVHDFNRNAEGHKSISEVINGLDFNADTTSKIFRFGTLNDIKNDEELTDTVYR